MDKAGYLREIAADAGKIVEAAQRNRDAETAQCPGWTVGHVVVHVGRAFRWIEHMVRTSAREPAFPLPNRDGHDRLAADLLPWFERGLHDFLATMQAADPDHEVWTWSQDRCVGFWLRLQAHETAIHRTDAQSALGLPEPISCELARDAIEGVLRWFVPEGRALSSLPCERNTMLLTESGSQRRWSLRIDDAVAGLESGDSAPDVRVQGTASDLLLFLWQRTGTARLQVDGDHQLVDRYPELILLP